MFGNKEFGGHGGQDDQQFAELSKRIERALHRLHQMKERVAQLKRKCEELKGMEWGPGSEHIQNSHCNKCGRVLDPDQEVVVKGSDGTIRIYYHRKCVQALFTRLFSS